MGSVLKSIYEERAARPPESIHSEMGSSNAVWGTMADRNFIHLEKNEYWKSQQKYCFNDKICLAFVQNNCFDRFNKIPGNPVLKTADWGIAWVLSCWLGADCELIILFLKTRKLKSIFWRFKKFSSKTYQNGLSEEKVFCQVTSKSLKTTRIVQQFFSHESWHSWIR